MNTPREDLAEVTEEDMQAYLELVSERLAEEYGFKRVYTNGHDDEAGAGPVDVDERICGHALRRRRRQYRPPQPACITASLLRSGLSFDETVRTVLDATKEAVAGDRRAAQLGLGRRAVEDRAHVRELHQQESGIVVLPAGRAARGV